MAITKMFTLLPQIPRFWSCFIYLFRNGDVFLKTVLNSIHVLKMHYCNILTVRSTVRIIHKIYCALRLTSSTIQLK